MNSRTDNPPQADSRFIIAVGGLLLLIIALLAGLWIKQRKRAQRAEQTVVTLTRQNSGMAILTRQQMQDRASRMAIHREDLQTRQVILDGRKLTALRLPAGEAQRLGLRPGDVVLVDQAPTPATAPATRPGA